MHATEAATGTGRFRRRATRIVAAAATAGAAALAAGPAGAAPTCSGELGIAVHGQHIVGDYVTGIGRENLAWPPRGGAVGDAVDGDGVAVAGGPGPGFHIPNGFAPGASFCIDQSSSPGVHL